MQFYDCRRIRIYDGFLSTFLSMLAEKGTSLSSQPERSTGIAYVSLICYILKNCVFTFYF